MFALVGCLLVPLTSINHNNVNIDAIKNVFIVDHEQILIEMKICTPSIELGDRFEICFSFPPEFKRKKININIFIKQVGYDEYLDYKLADNVIIGPNLKLRFELEAKEVRKFCNACCNLQWKETANSLI